MAASSGLVFCQKDEVASDEAVAVAAVVETSWWMEGWGE